MQKNGSSKKNVLIILIENKATKTKKNITNKPFVETYDHILKNENSTKNQMAGNRKRLKYFIGTEEEN